MAITISKLFTPVQLTTVDTVLFTLGASPATNVLKNGRVRLTNTTNAAATATLNADAAANTSGAANCFLNSVSIAGNGYLDVDIPTMAAGDTLRGLASAGTTITMHELAGIIYS